jgi:hypothetical protein
MISLGTRAGVAKFRRTNARPFLAVFVLFRDQEVRTRKPAHISALDAEAPITACLLHVKPLHMGREPSCWGMEPKLVDQPGMDLVTEDTPSMLGDDPGNCCELARPCRIV